MKQQHLRSGTDVFGVTVAYGLLGLGGLLVLVSVLARWIDNIVAPAGYAVLGAVMFVLGLSMLLVTRDNGVHLDDDGIRVRRPMQRSVRVPWSQVARISKPTAGVFMASQAIVLTDGSRVPTSLSSIDTRLKRAFQVRSADGQTGAESPEPGPEDGR